MSANPKRTKQFIMAIQYFPMIFLWVLVAQLSWIAGSGAESTINTFETLGLFGLIPMPSWLVILALVFSGIIASIQTLPFRIKLIPALVIISYGLTVAINTDLSASAMLSPTYLIGCACAFLIIWYMVPILEELSRSQREIQEKTLAVSEHLIKLENNQAQKASHVPSSARSISG